MVLNRKNVDGIKLVGGTILGTSRGGADIKCAPDAPVIATPLAVTPPVVGEDSPV